MKLLCISDVIMTKDACVAFKAGEYYDFHMMSNGNIQRFSGNCLHKFMCSGPDKWTNYFKYESEE